MSDFDFVKHITNKSMTHVISQEMQERHLLNSDHRQ